MNDINPTIGHNRGLPAAIAAELGLPEQVTEFLEEESGALRTEVDEALARAREIPRVIEDDDAMGRCAKVIKDLRDLAKKTSGLRELFKTPYFRASQAVDNFFFPLEEKCQRRIKTAKPGAADVLQARLDDYNQKKLAREREERRRKEEEAAKVAAEARRAQEAAARKAEEDRLAAARAQKAETQAAKGAVADLSEKAAAEARAESDRAAQRAQEAHIEALARPADMVRTRVDEGVTVTMGRQPFAIIKDEELLDKEKLWPFISTEAKEKALRAWAKTTGHSQQMPGAAVGFRDKSKVL